MRFIELTEPVEGRYTGNTFLVNVHQILTMKEVCNWEGKYSHTLLDMGGAQVKCVENSHDIMVKIRG